MACVVVLELHLKEECIDQLKSGFKEMLPDTRAYDGCIDIYATQDQDNPTTIIAIEKWETRQHYEKYLAWRTERGDFGNVIEMCTEPPNIRYFDPVDV